MTRFLCLFGHRWTVHRLSADDYVRLCGRCGAQQSREAFEREVALFMPPYRVEVSADGCEHRLIRSDGTVALIARKP